MLDINKRVRCEGTTVAEMIEALQRLPQDGIVHFEALERMWRKWEITMKEN